MDSLIDPPSLSADPGIPSSLYKYQSFTPQNLENLKNQIIYFGSSDQFNDPYDCAIVPLIKVLPDDFVENYRRTQLANIDMSAEWRHYYETLSIGDLRNSLMGSGREALDMGIKMAPKKFGISCFTEKNDNLLMWSHYGDHHRGFCLEFDTKSPMFQKVRPVNYVEEVPEFDTTPLLMGEPSKSADLLCIKSGDWKYEKEWRIIHSQVGTSYRYSSGALTGVYFGLRASMAMIEIAALILAGQNQTVRLWKANRNNAKFAVEFETFDYISYLDAKHQGLL